MQENRDVPVNRIVGFFCKKTVLITGGSGFLGKVLIEKLLRSCPLLEKIYVIIRDKKGKNPQERLRQILDGPLFDRLKSEHGANIVRKVEAVCGDVSAPGLGLSPEDRGRVVEDVEIIYHSAATVRFDEPLKDTVLLNVRGTKLMLELAKECEKLMVFCYVSTAYCHEEQEVLLEELYPAPASPDGVIHLCEWMDDSALSAISKQLKGKSVNNYTFSKALAEALIGEEMNRLPVIILRPSVVLPIWKEPIPGWTDNLNGPAGLLAGAGKGVIRTMYAREDIFMDCIPVDVVINGLIISAYDFCTYQTRRVCNLTASDETERMGITAKSVLDMGRTIINERVAFNRVLWYPNGSLKQSRISHVVAFVLFQLLPAVLVDAVLFVLGARPFLLKVQKRVWKGYDMLEYYANRKWNFDNENAKVGRNLLNSTEREMFKVDSEGFDALEYFVDCTLACRRYIMKEPDESLEPALRRMKVLRYLDFLCKFFFVVGILYYCINMWVLNSNS